ncbi:MAG: SIS domain-containing protein [Candidatus Korarchaeota archaeon]|nr:SIS domain-containing protein [Candidatus Korarchaeota archaeon]NIU83615.1 SIS domain-containing protein [Candidatus Thorarchaeota archaeon]NIW14123.1 SIS domain-containing protein [Candidatus Thorarchaeota archaeon]NIW52230.1 SIS domain-containing protein [Candidatus Korarchaeota archaeon]
MKHILKAVRGLQDVEEIVFAGKGRSGYAAKIGEGYLSDVGKRVSFFNAPSAPGVETFNQKKIALVCVSGSGETAEVVQAAKDYKNKGATTISITASPESSLREYSDVIVKVTMGEGRDRTGSYLGRQIVRPETPTMGDESEEMSLLSLYLIAKKIEIPNLSIEKEGEKEIKNLKHILKQNSKSYIAIKDALNTYRNSGIYFIGMGKSEIVSHMVSNRAHHYDFEVYATGNSTNPPINFHNLAVIISGSGSAGGLLSHTIEKAKEECAKVGKVSNRVGVACVVGRKGGIHKEGDISLALGGARECRIPTIDAKGRPEPFYFRAPVTFNMILREIAKERGITVAIARERHINI